MSDSKSASTIEFAQMDGGMGLEVRGLDLAEEITDEAATLLKEKLANHGLLVFRDQELTEEEQIRFTRAFGETIGHPIPGVGGGDTGMESEKEIFYLINDPEKENKVAKRPAGDGTLGWHSDLEYMPEPQVYSVLYGMEIPPEGGDTEWCNLADAYDALDEDTKMEVADMQIVRWYARAIPQVCHPAVRIHPISGRKCLYVSPNLCKYIDGKGEEEGKARILELSDHVTQERFCYIHQWRKGDVIMWDNRLTLHRRHGFDVQKRRVVRRTQTAGEPVLTHV
jgi:alpha-ketoglutarate-dependent taurine dioxygenase